MMSRQVRRKWERDQARAGKVVREGVTVAQLKEAEAELADGAVVHESSPATTLAVLAHSWYALDHQREASRMTYQRIIELRKGGRELKTDALVQQYAEAKAEILVVESQIRELLVSVAREDTADVALALLGNPHTNMMNGIGVRFPRELQDRLALETGLIEMDAEPEKATPEGEEARATPEEPKKDPSDIDPPEPSEPKA